MTSNDPVREFLAGRGAPEDVVSSGLDGLVAEWERTVRQIESGYPLGLDDYLNDLDGRQLLEDVLEVAAEVARDTATKRLEIADARARRNVRWVDECLWGARVADREGWTRDGNWWYFAVPRSPGPLLREDLDASE